MSEHRLGGKRAHALGIRACGGNVLLRRVKQDGGTIIIFDRQPGVLQLGEIIGLGGRWTQDSPWSPPFSQQDKARADDLEREQRALMGAAPGVSAWKPMWRFPDSSTPRPPTPVFTPIHEGLVGHLHVGDLVIFNQARVYEVFKWEGDDILVYPGNWILGVVSGLPMDVPEVRRYEEEAV